MAIYSEEALPGPYPRCLGTLCYSFPTEYNLSNGTGRTLKGLKLFRGLTSSRKLTVMISGTSSIERVATLSIKNISPIQILSLFTLILVCPNSTTGQTPTQTDHAANAIFSEYTTPPYLSPSAQAATVVVGGEQYTVVVSEGTLPNPLKYVLYKNGVFQGSGPAFLVDEASFVQYDIGSCACSVPPSFSRISWIWEFSLIHSDDGTLVLSVYFQDQPPPIPRVATGLSLFSFTPPDSPGAPIFSEFAKVVDSTRKCESVEGCEHPESFPFSDCGIGGDGAWRPQSFGAVAIGASSFEILATAARVTDCDNPDPATLLYSFPVSLGGYHEIWPEDLVAFLPAVDPLPPSFPDDTPVIIESVARDLSSGDVFVTYRLGFPTSSLYRLNMGTLVIDEIPGTASGTSYSMSGDNPWMLIQNGTNANGARLVRSDQLAGTTLSFSSLCQTYFNRIQPAAWTVGWPSQPYYLTASLSSQVDSLGQTYAVMPDNGQVRLYTLADLPATNPRTIFRHDTLAPFKGPGGIVADTSKLALESVGPITYNPQTDALTTLLFLVDTSSGNKYTLISEVSQAALAHLPGPEDDFQMPLALPATPPLNASVVSTRGQTPTGNFAVLQAVGEDPATSGLRDIWLGVPFSTAAQYEQVRLTVSSAEALDCAPIFLTSYDYVVAPPNVLTFAGAKATFDTASNPSGFAFDFTMSRNGTNALGLVRLATNSPNDVVIQVQSLGSACPLNADANCDGQLNVADVTEIYNLVTGIISPPLAGDGDVDNNGLVESTDAGLLVDFLANGVPLPP